MNDEFLYRLRKQPRTEFATQLKARLNRQAPVPASRKRHVALYVLIALLVGGGAFAWVARTARKEPPPPVAIATTKSAPEPAQPAPAPPSPKENKPRPKASWMWGGEPGTEEAPATATLSSPAAAPVTAPVRTRGQLYIVSSWPTSALPPTTPHIQRIRNAEALRLFCRGTGARYPDAALVLRRMNAQDAEACSKRSESAILELKVGYEAIVLARDVASGPLALSSRDLLLALAREIPDPDQPGAFIINPNFTWRQVNPALPNERIDVAGPAAGSTTHEAFVQLLLDNRAVRNDGVYSEANDKDSVARALIDRPNAIGFLSYSSFLLYAGKLTAGAIDGVPPTYETFASGAYSASRALYVYTKKSHIDGAPDLVRFLSGYASDETIGPNGYLAGRGIVPLNASERAKTRTALLTGK